MCSLEATAQMLHQMLLAASGAASRCEGAAAAAGCKCAEEVQRTGRHTVTGGRSCCVCQISRQSMLSVDAGSCWRGMPAAASAATSATCLDSQFHSRQQTPAASKRAHVRTGTIASAAGVECSRRMNGVQVRTLELRRAGLGAVPPRPGGVDAPRLAIVLGRDAQRHRLHLLRLQCIQCR